LNAVKTHTPMLRFVNVRVARSVFQSTVWRTRYYTKASRQKPTFVFLQSHRCNFTIGKCRTVRAIRTVLESETAIHFFFFLLKKYLTIIEKSNLEKAEEQYDEYCQCKSLNFRSLQLASDDLFKY